MKRPAKWRAFCMGCTDNRGVRLFGGFGGLALCHGFHRWFAGAGGAGDGGLCLGVSFGFFRRARFGGSCGGGLFNLSNHGCWRFKARHFAARCFDSGFDHRRLFDLRLFDTRLLCAGLLAARLLGAGLIKPLLFRTRLL